MDHDTRWTINNRCTVYYMIGRYREMGMKKFLIIEDHNMRWTLCTECYEQRLKRTMISSKLCLLTIMTGWYREKQECAFEFTIVDHNMRWIFLLPNVTRKAENDSRPWCEVDLVYWLWWRHGIEKYELKGCQLSRTIICAGLCLLDVMKRKDRPLP